MAGNRGRLRYGARPGDDAAGPRRQPPYRREDRRHASALAYSLLRHSDDGRLFVQKLGLYENKLQLYAREVELKYGLQILSNEPRPGARRADRNELEESRRLGTDVHAIRSAILDSLTKSDNGRSFDAAIKERNWIVAGGDRNCYVVIDEQGGKHALNKKLTGMTLKEIDARLGDLDRTKLPSVDQAQQMQRDRAAQQAQEREKHGRAADAPGQERGRSDGPQRGPQPEIKPLGQTAGEMRLAWQLSKTGEQFAQAIENRGLDSWFTSAARKPPTATGRGNMRKRSSIKTAP